MSMRAPSRKTLGAAFFISSRLGLAVSWGRAQGTEMRKHSDRAPRMIAVRFFTVMLLPEFYPGSPTISESRVPGITISIFRRVSFPFLPKFRFDLLGNSPIRDHRQKKGEERPNDSRNRREFLSFPGTRKHLRLFDFLSVPESPPGPWGTSPVGSPRRKADGVPLH